MYTIYNTSGSLFNRATIGTVNHIDEALPILERMGEVLAFDLDEENDAADAALAIDGDLVIFAIERGV